MDLNEFFEKLGQIDCRWSRTSSGSIRSYSTDGEFCPITRVAWALGKGRFPTDCVEVAATALQLNHSDMLDVVTAADYMDGPPKFREQLLTACHLTNPLSLR